ncbi:sensor histidine kinase [Sphingomicrobium astaxanthinifaciens]|uniref:sensor histidine kinase n=1 Tax=Sphingomicrobium astaxanthinifaciens TaxID=1227949 RepID=UPI001FCBF596|nr:sensor histidine kinase [Sphingomicrobium astaxanthinifaciens]MCJ7420498.1 PAS domain-containing protein [Sphingomicrobium astaxanthinifaciens]
MPDIQQFENSSADLLRLVIETGHIGIWKLDVATGHAWRNRRHDEIFGYPDGLAEWTYEMFLDHVVEEDRARVDELQQQALEQQTEWLFDCRIVRADGVERWINAAGRPIFDDDGSITALIGNVIDITQTKRNEMRLSLVTQELNHRVRNMLTMVKALISLSGRSAKVDPAFVNALSGRVEALARTQDLLLGETDRDLGLGEILERELTAFPSLRERVDLQEDDVIVLAPKDAQAFAVIIHELITNAIKYGAFSNDAGRVAITIATTPSQARVEWRETGGPPVAEVREDGLGSNLIGRALGPSGRAQLDFHKDGLVCRIELDRERTRRRSADPVRF